MVNEFRCKLSSACVLAVSLVMESWAAPPAGGMQYGYGSWEAGVELSSRYVSEGLDLAPGRAAVSGDMIARWQRLGLSVDWARAIGQAVGESRLGCFYELDMKSFDMGDVRLSAGGRHVRFTGMVPRSSWELFYGLVWGLNSGMVIDLDGFMDVSRRRAGFMNMTVLWPYPVGMGTPNRLTLVPALQLGIDYGIVSGRRRLRDNHAAFELAAQLAVTQQAHLVVALAHSVPLDALDALPGGRELTWGRIGMQMRF